RHTRFSHDWSSDVCSSDLISLIMHPRSPRVPTVHMNTRFLSTAKGWFGGGADLTPMLPEQRTQHAPDAVAFHAAMKQACDAHDPAYYGKFKPRSEERRVGEGGRS